MCRNRRCLRLRRPILQQTGNPSPSRDAIGQRNGGHRRQRGDQRNGGHRRQRGDQRNRGRGLGRGLTLAFLRTPGYPRSFRGRRGTERHHPRRRSPSTAAGRQRRIRDCTMDRTVADLAAAQRPRLWRGKPAAPVRAESRSPAAGETRPVPGSPNGSACHGMASSVRRYSSAHPILLAGSVTSAASIPSASRPQHMKDTGCLHQFGGWCSEFNTPVFQPISHLLKSEANSINASCGRPGCARRMPRPRRRGGHVFAQAVIACEPAMTRPDDPDRERQLVWLATGQHLGLPRASAGW